MRETTLPLSHFESIYSRGEDPWRFASSEYERAKYAATVAALPRRRYASAFEVGCSIGVLTGLLAERCDRVLAVEPVLAALEAARRRNADRPQVRFAPMFIPADWPDEFFDLVVLSEVLDYIGHDDLIRTAGAIRRSLLPGGHVVLVHWIGKKRGAAAEPGESSDALIAALAPEISAVSRTRNADYRLDLLEGAPAV